jgi:hypothetical protein
MNNQPACDGRQSSSGEPRNISVQDSSRRRRTSGSKNCMASVARSVIAVIPVLVLVGCASVHVNKLNAAGKLDKDAPEGMRFYMPRPYVAVNEPFVIASSVFLAAGEMSPDGSFVLLTEVPEELKSEIAVNPTLKNGGQKTMGGIAIDATKVLVSTPAPGGGPQGAPAGNPTPTKPAPATPPGANTPAQAPADGSAASTPGVVETKVTNDNQAFAVTPLPRFFTIAWLPDWDEEYVIRTKSGLGSANANINLGQGWSLQGLDAKVDNSALVKPLLDFYSATFGALQKVATAKIEGPLALVTGKPQGAPAGKTPPPTANTEFKGGTLVTVKITKASIVAPGLYKILKPKEINDMPASLDGKHILKPIFPLSDIPFNTYDVIVIEAARATGDSAFTLGQYTEATSKSAANVPATPPTKGPTDTTNPLKAPQTKLNVVLAQPENTTTKGIYYVATLSTDSKTGDVLAALATTNGGKPGKLAELKSDDEVTKLVIDTLAPGIKVDAKNVTVKH